MPCKPKTMLMGLDTVSPSNGEMIYNLASSAAVDFSPACNGKTKNPKKKDIKKRKFHINALLQDNT